MLVVKVRATVLRGLAETSDPAHSGRALLPLRSAWNRAPRGPAHTRAQSREVLVRLGAAHPFDYRRQEFTHDRARYGVIMKTASPSEVFVIYWMTNFSDRWFKPGREM